MNRLLSSFKSLPMQLLFCVTVGFVLAPHLDIFFIQLFYTLSIGFIDVLMTILPVIIFIYIFCSMVGLDRRSPLFVGLILGSVTLSNLLALFTAYGVGLMVLPMISIPNVADILQNTQGKVDPLWAFRLPKFLSTDKAMFAGFLVGIMASFLPTKSVLKEKLIHHAIKARDGVTMGLQKTFIPLLPLYIAGFCLKLSYEKSILFLLEYYAPVFLLSLGVVFTYVGLLYAVASGFNGKRMVQLIRNMIPAGLTAFSTMSSAATLPVTLKSTVKNIHSQEHTNLVVPATANIHMLGDDITIVLMAMALLIMDGQSMPGLVTFIFFAGAFSFAKLSCVGIPGASVLVILPVLEEFLGFNATMISIVTTIYVLQDSFGTCSNVMGNGAFAVLLDKLFGWCNLKKIPQPQEEKEVLAA